MPLLQSKPFFKPPFLHGTENSNETLLKKSIKFIHVFYLICEMHETIERQKNS